MASFLSPLNQREDGYGGPRVVCSPKALELIAQYRLKAIAVSLTHDKTRASASAVAEPA